jgi:Domain of unknown function (DU1801)
MVNALDNFFLGQTEPTKGCLLYLRHFILDSSKHFTEHWKYGLPFYYYKGKPCCYLWHHKKFKMPYLSFVDGNKMNHRDLLLEKRARMKIFLIDAEKDIPVQTLNVLLKEAIALLEKKLSA